MQLWALGRAAVPAVLKAENPDYPYVSASDIPFKATPDVIPRPLTVAGMLDINNFSSSSPYANNLYAI